MNLLIIGDVHGCYHTLKFLVDTHWKPEEEILIQIGDLINKGPYSLKCIRYWRKLEKKYPEKVLMIKGNHEQQFVDDDAEQPKFPESADLLRAIKVREMKVKKIKKWLNAKPLKWENDHILITHAGVAKSAEFPFSEKAKNGVLYNKGVLKFLPRVQVKGHSIVSGDKPVFNPKENAWYIDTGAWTKKYLSALRLSPNGEKLEVVRVATEREDKIVRPNMPVE